jgi:hypothetical protein
MPYDMRPGRGDCANCGEAISESRTFEFVYGRGLRPVVILVHTEHGHERCEDRETVAERGSSPSPG